MKFEPNSKMTTIAVYAFLVLAAAIVFTMLISNIGGMFGWLDRLSNVLLPIIYGFVLAFLLNPMMRMFDDRVLPWLFKKKIRRGLRRGISIALTYITAFIFISLFLAIVLPQLIESLMGIGNNVPFYLKSLQNYYQTVIQRINEYSGDAGESAEIINTVAAKTLDSIEGLLEQMGEWLAGLMSGAISVVTQITSAVVDILLGIIISIYFLADREKMFAQIRKICYAVLPKKIFDLLYDIVIDTNRVFSGFIIGKIIDSVIIGILCFFGMSILRMPYVTLISVIVGLTNVIPYFGPFIGAIPGFMLVFLISPIQSLWFLIFIFILQQFDGNILGPKILGDTTGLSAFWVIFSITLFSGMLGFVGMFIGVPLFAMIYSVIKRFITYLLKRKDLPVNTREYVTEKNPLIK